MDLDIGTLIFWLIVITVAIFNWSRRGKTETEDMLDIPDLRREDLPDATRRLYGEKEIPVAQPKTKSETTRRPSPRMDRSPSPVQRKSDSPVQRRVETAQRIPRTADDPRMVVPSVPRRRVLEEDDFESMVEGEEAPRRQAVPVRKTAGRPAAKHAPASPVSVPRGPEAMKRKSAPAAEPPRVSGAMAARASSPVASSPTKTPTRGHRPGKSIGATLRDPVNRRRAVLYREILAPPPGMRLPDTPIYDYPNL